MIPLSTRVSIDLCSGEAWAEIGGQYIRDDMTALCNSAHRRTTGAE
jgi:hypothetical protein